MVQWVNFVAGYQINPDSTVDKEMRVQRFFSLYFKKFKYIVLSNLLFSVPVLISAAYVYGTYVALGGLNLIAASAAMIILSPFVSGLTLVSRYICTGKKFSVTKAYFKGIKENWSKFLLNGIILYAVSVISFCSMTVYYKGTASSGIFWFPLIITALISLFVLFASYYANIMTVTMDIKLKDIYLNCILFSFGELKNNLIVTLALIIFSLLVSAVLIFFFTPILLIVAAALLTALIIPSTVQYIITFCVYDDMVKILDKSQKAEEKENRKHSESTSAKPSVNKSEAEEISRLAPDTTDEYIFHNGRMIKRSIVENQLNNENNDDF